MKLIYIATAYLIIWIAGRIATHLDRLAMKRTQDYYNRKNLKYRKVV
jgi:hypothetical protein